MDLTFITENKGFIDKKDIVRDKNYNVRKILLEMIEVHTAKDFLEFLSQTPYSFFSKFFFTLNGDRETLKDLLPYNEKHFYKGSLEKIVRNNYLDIDYLDEFLIREGVLGPVVKKTQRYADGQSFTYETIESDGEFEYISLSSIETLIGNIQKLAQYAAAATQEDVDNLWKKQPLHGNTNAQIIESGVAAYSDFNSDYKQDSPLALLFNENEIHAIKERAEALGYEVCDWDIQGNEGCSNKFFVVRTEMSDSEIAAFIFTWFMNSLFEGGSEQYFSGNTFKVEFTNGKFKVYKPHSPIRELYYELAKFAEAGNIKLCANCQRAFIDGKSRGNEALYCSRSCNTKASNRRRDLTKQYRAAGVPIENAINEIGKKYEKSIRTWYEQP